MAPPRKRARSASIAAQESQAATKCIHVHSDAVKVFLDELDTIESTKPVDSISVLASAASMLVDVKSSQREMFKLLDTATQNRDDKREELERQKLLLQNLAYEKNQLKAQLDACKEYPTPHLESMSRDELNDKDEPAGNVMNLFLCGTVEKSIQDPKHHKTVMTKLHKELNARGSLQRDLEKAQSSLSKRKVVAEKEEAFLRDIPKKLEMIEKSSIPLQEFFQSSATSNTVRLIGSDRKKRFDLAKSLPGPLYSLFVQFQAHLDNQGNESVSLQIARHSKGKKTDEVAPDPQVVHLSFIVPVIHSKETASTKKKRVTVEFAFVHEYSLVTARAFGFNEKINTQTLLTNLFPGDSGIWTGQPNESTRLAGTPYHWCNFLAGLHLPPPQSPERGVHLSTKAVVREIEKRVRANVTLTQILTTFEKKKVISHPSFADKLNVSDCSARLTGWTVVDEETAKQSEVVYAATIKNSSSTLSARVLVNWCQYPAVRPLWSLCEGEEAWAKKKELGSIVKLQGETNQLYSCSIGQIESQINGEAQSFADSTDDTSYDWIIAHQLIKLMRLWDEAQEGGNSNEGHTRGSTRSRKGRDRVSST